MKKAKRIFLILICLLIFSLSVGSCGYLIPFLPSHVPEEESAYVYPAFETAYTEEEHLQKIREKITQSYTDNQAEILDYHIEIVYSFYDYQPEYFLITVEYAQEDFLKGQYYAENEKGEYVLKEYATKYEHIIGRIVNDLYTHCEYCIFIDGRSPWDFCGYGERKKYYCGGLFGVETQDGILQFFNKNSISNSRSLEFCPLATAWEQKVLSTEEQKKLKTYANSTVWTRYELYQKEIKNK